MDLAFHSIHYSPFFGGTTPLFDVLAATAAAGVSHIGLDLWSIDAYVAGSGGTAEQIRDELDRLGLACSDLIVVALDRDRHTAVATARHMASLAEQLGSPLGGIVVLEERDRAETLQVVDECASILADHGVRQAIEFTSYSALTTLADVCAVCEEVGWERIGIMLDSLHVGRVGTPYSDVATLDAAQIALVQFADAAAEAPLDLRHDSRNERRVPGAGGLPLHDFVAAVRATGYDGTVVAEVLSDEVRAGDPHVDIRRIHEALRSYWTVDALIVPSSQRLRQ
jgi:4-hydroxyphenylpyruvate dioxygenase